MKQLIYLLLPFLFAASCGRNVQLNDPAVDENRTGYVTVARIEATADSTVLDLELRGRPGNWVRLDPACILRGDATGREYAVAGSDFPLGEKVTMDSSGMRCARIVFEPLDRQERKVDFIEPGDEGYQILGIHLGKVPSPRAAVHCRIEGRVHDRPASSLLLLYAHIDGDASQNSRPTAMVPVRDGRFACDIYLEEPDICTLIFADELMNGSWYRINFIADNGTIRMDLYPEDRFQEKRIEGPAATEEYEEYNRMLKAVSQKYTQQVDSLHDCGRYYTEECNALHKKLEQGVPSEERKKLLAQLSELYDSGRAMTEETRALIDACENAQRTCQLEILGGEPTVARYALLGGMLAYKLPEKEFVDLFETRYAPAMPDHYLTSYCRRRIDGFRLAPGSKYVDFTAPNLEGKEHRLSDLIAGSKVALIDLWASWCGPCRRSAMAVIPVYEKYKERGFRVVGIAREKHDTRALEKAIATDGYPWITLVELNDRGHIWARYGKDNAAGVQILVDSAGTILALDPSIEELERLVAERVQP